MSQSSFLANAATSNTLTGLPIADDDFDAFINREGWHAINDVATVEILLLRAAARFHALDASPRAGIDDDTLSVKELAWCKLHEQFASPISDLRMFFSEASDFRDQLPSERRRMFEIADLLVGSARDVSRLSAAQALSNAARELV